MIIGGECSNLDWSLKFFLIYIYIYICVCVYYVLLLYINLATTPCFRFQTLFCWFSLNINSRSFQLCRQQSSVSDISALKICSMQCKLYSRKCVCVCVCARARVRVLMLNKWCKIMFIVISIFRFSKSKWTQMCIHLSSPRRYLLID
jgi:hypothetical protein